MSAPEAWECVAGDFHERVREACWDSLAGELATLHRPHLDLGLPVCRGCDRDRGEHGSADPVWPCRTYTVIAATVLKLTDVEDVLTSRLRLHRWWPHDSPSRAG